MKNFLLFKYFISLSWYIRYSMYVIFIVLLKFFWIYYFTAESKKDILDRRNHHLFAPLVGDAIILTMKSSCLWDDRFLN